MLFSSLIRSARDAAVRYGTVHRHRPLSSLHEHDHHDLQLYDWVLPEAVTGARFPCAEQEDGQIRRRHEIGDGRRRMSTLRSCVHWYMP